MKHNGIEQHGKGGGGGLRRPICTYCDFALWYLGNSLVKHKHSHLRSLPVTPFRMSTPEIMKMTFGKIFNLLQNISVWNNNLKLYSTILKTTLLRFLDFRPDFGGLNQFYEHSTMPLPSEHISGVGSNSISLMAFELLHNQMTSPTLRAVLDAVSITIFLFPFGMPKRQGICWKMYCRIRYCPFILESSLQTILYVHNQRWGLHICISFWHMHETGSPLSGLWFQ